MLLARRRSLVRARSRPARLATALAPTSAALVALAVAAPGGAAGAPAPGTLDPSFGAGGLVSAPSGARLFGTAVQPDGKVVATGESGTAATLTVARYTAAGVLDPSFGAGGVAQGPAIAGTFRPSSLGRAVAIQPDGKIVVVGKATSGDGSGRFAMIVERFNANGSLDGSFGTGGVATLLSTQAGDGYAVALQPDGKILAGGSADVDGSGGLAPRVALVRLSANGSPDPSFGAGGIDLVDLGAYSYSLALALQDDGRIVIAGSQAPALQVTNALLARLTPGGALDPSFDGTGMFAHQYAQSAAFSSFNGVAIEPDGKIVAAGAAADGNTGADAIVARFQASGAADGGFGSGGVATTTSATSLLPSGTTPGANGVTIAAGGDIVAAGTSANSIVTTGTLWAFTSSGAADTAFGSGGAAALPSSGGDITEATAIAQSPATGELFAVGDLQPPPYSGTAFTAIAAGFGGFGALKPPPPPPPPPKPPALKLTLGHIGRSYATSGVARRGLKLTVGCNQPCSIRVTLSVSARTARQLHLRVRGSRAVTIATARGSLAKSGAASVTVRLSRSLARALERPRRVSVTLTASASADHTTKTTGKPLQFRR